MIFWTFCLTSFPALHAGMGVMPECCLPTAHPLQVPGGVKVILPYLVIVGAACLDRFCPISRTGLHRAIEIVVTVLSYVRIIYPVVLNADPETGTLKPIGNRASVRNRYGGKQRDTDQ